MIFLKVSKIVGISLIMAFTFLSQEYLLYSLIKSSNKLFYIVLALVLTTMMLYIMVLNKLAFYNKWVNPVIVLSSVFAGLAALKLLLNIIPFS